ncbi:sigma-70 family RNA polymerase sigma factor [Lacimicrobium alkaliphilum]|uniref:RNA polymerase sigma-70 ECF-like HTH domain-containing protein n=1 Tax=Lacimicrobium alkaliphilum TaxID=1526571 RepID=A0A0U3B489_9ALTE|nr:sigma-70 family RNA polymerase sigma factor [Lacimicrobium alkaliphilum]ALT00041.1 hypothetical protein AT746_18375 [Lacimicrobium alkaliphilum]
MKSKAEITRLLKSWQQGDEMARNELTERVYAELHRMAMRKMAQEQQNHTLQATALVNEAFLRLFNADVDYKDRAHFFCLAGRMLRRILVDHARSAGRSKRGMGAEHITLHESQVLGQNTNPELLDLDQALISLSQKDSRKAEVVELQFFAGLNAEEIADVLSVSTKTVERDGKFAKAWLHKTLAENRMAV